MHFCNTYLNVLVSNVLYFYSMMYSFMDELVVRVFTIPMPLYVYKVIQYQSNDEDEIDRTDDYRSGNVCLDVSSDDSRIEYRVLWKRTKRYRIISTNKKQIQPQHEMFVGGGKLSTYIKPVCAVLNNPDENVEDNVLERVLKYMGPRYDFFGQSVKMSHLFENDDLQENTELHMLLSNGKYVSYKPDDIITF